MKKTNLMKKWWVPMIALCSGMAPTTGACTPDTDPGNPEKSVPASVPDPGPQPKSGRCLVVYFSCTGTTRGIAGQIAGITGGDTWEIRPEAPYTAADLDYRSDCRANREQNDPSARPAIRGRMDNLADYDVVFLGYPIWWGKAPKIVSTFLENHDLSGKTLVPFCTSGSSGVGSSDTDLHALAPKAVWKPGKRFGSGSTREEIARWLKSAGIVRR